MMVGGIALHQVHPFVAQPNNLFQAQPPISHHHINSLQEFKQAHARFIKLGLDRVPRCAGELLSACALSAWGSLDYARSMFDCLDDPGMFEFNTIIRAHADRSNPNAALCMYRQMMQKHVQADGFTFTFALKACAVLLAIKEGMQIHANVFKFGFHDDIYVQNSLINLYGKCEDIELACKVFEQMGRNRTVASWSTVLAAHNRTCSWADCIDTFASMIAERMRPDESSAVSALSACAHLGALGLGRSIHCSAIRNFTGLNVVVQTALLDMYMKCGCAKKGLTVFDSMRDRNAWTYSALISGLAMHGDGRKALEFFADMSRDGIEPDGAVFVGVLSACSHAGLVEEGLRCFDRMRFERRVEPDGRHYGCVVDLVGRAGKLDDALALVSNMPAGLPTDAAWRSLLSACKVHGNIEMAERAIGNLVELNCVKAGDFVILSNMYSKMRRWDDAATVRTKSANQSLSHELGFSRVEAKGRMHTFVSQDRSHPRSDEVYEMLHQIEWQLRFEGYRPDTSDVSLQDADEEEKQQVVAGHSQKLAISFALLNTGKSEPILIFTNLRMSSECHSYAKLISTIFERDVTVRDRKRFHCFRRGSCSCGDFW